MILDTLATFSGAVGANGALTGQSITATAISTNVLDLRQPHGAPALADDGIGCTDLWLEIRARTAAAGGDVAKTLTITLESAANSGLSSATVHYSTAAILGADIAAGAVLARFALPSADYKRYLGLRYTVSATFTAFELLAHLTTGVQAGRHHAGGFTVS